MFLIIFCIIHRLLKKLFSLWWSLVVAAIFLFYFIFHQNLPSKHAHKILSYTMILDIFSDCLLCFCATFSFLFLHNPVIHYFAPKPCTLHLFLLKNHTAKEKLFPIHMKLNKKLIAKVYKIKFME